MKLLRPLDLVIVFIIVVASAISFFIVDQRKGATAEVYVGSRHVATLSLTGKSQIKPVSTRIGNVQIEYGDGGIRVLNSPCRHKICMLKGVIKDVHERIICLPAQLYITIVDSDNPDNSFEEIDAFSY